MTALAVAEYRVQSLDQEQDRQLYDRRERERHATVQRWQTHYGNGDGCPSAASVNRAGADLFLGHSEEKQKRIEQR